MQYLINLMLPSLVKGLTVGLEQMYLNKENAAWLDRLRSLLFAGYKVPAQMTADFESGKEY